MKCCYSSPHLCEKCGKDFSCGGSGGFSGQTTDEYGRIVCSNCYENINIPSVCWYCSKFFEQQNYLII